MLNEQEYKDTIRLLIQQRDNAVAACKLAARFVAYPYGREWSAESAAARNEAEKAIQAVDQILPGSIPRQ